jgi:ribokinase
MGTSGLSPASLPPAGLPLSGPRAFVLGNFIQVGCWFIPRLPQASDTVLASKVHFEPGGKGLNVMLGLHRLGCDVDTLVGIGRDAPADDFVALCTDNGINTRHVHRFPGNSGWGSGWIGDNGQYAGAVYLGANLDLGADHVHAAAEDIRAAGLLYGQFETSLTAVVESFATAHRAGVATVLNPSPWQTPPTALHASTHTVLANEIEAQYLLALPGVLIPAGNACANDIPEVLDTLKAQLPAFWQTWVGTQRLVVTLGALGAMAIERDGTTWYAPGRALHAVDSVGAGDAFASGYAHAMLSGQPLAQALRAGNACGAHVTTQVGVLQALPNAAQLAQLLQAVDLPLAVRL